MRAIIIVAALAALGPALSGCVAYDVASTTVGAATSVVGTTVDVAGDVVSAPFGGSDSDSDKKSR